MEMELILINRGDIYYAGLDPTIGSEVNKKRPVIIVSNDAANKVSNLVTVIPLTSTTHKIYNFEVLLGRDESGLKKNSKAQCQQIRAVSKQRLDKNPVGKVSAEKMQSIDKALRLHLGL